MGRKQRTARTAVYDPQHQQELDIESFSDSLRPYGLAIRDVSNDGNCFFRAVSDQLYGSEHYHMKLRERVCDYLDRHADHYRSFIDEEQSFEDYVNDMRADGVWADNLELQAISMAYHVNIRVHQSGKPSYDIRNHDAKNADAIHLSYHFGEHYASVRPLRTADLQVPAQHDPLPLPRDASSSNSESHHTRDSASRRPRYSRHHEDVEAVWKRAERGHCDVCALVERTRKAVRTIRTSESAVDANDEKRETARKIERDMKDARILLENVAHTIKDGKAAHRSRTRKLASLSSEARYSTSNTSNTSNADYSDRSASFSEDDDDDYEYSRSVKRESDMVFARLNETENSVLSALEKVRLLVEDESTESAASSKHVKGGKKKEQELRRKERKEKRRRDQERLARRGATDDMRADQLGRIPELDIAI